MQSSLYTIKKEDAHYLQRIGNICLKSSLLTSAVGSIIYASHLILQQHSSPEYASLSIILSRAGIALIGSGLLTLYGTFIGRGHIPPTSDLEERLMIDDSHC